MRRLRNQSGFTLVELTISIVLISLLLIIGSRFLPIILKEESTQVEELTESVSYRNAVKTLKTEVRRAEKVTAYYTDNLYLKLEKGAQITIYKYSNNSLYKDNELLVSDLTTLYVTPLVTSLNPSPITPHKIDIINNNSGEKIDTIIVRSESIDGDHTDVEPDP